MKKRSARDIPDFSSHKPHRVRPEEQAAARKPAPPPPRAPAVKPQATATKSGRRGQ